MIDCFDGKVVSYALSNHPDQCLEDEMLEGSLSTLDTTECKNLVIIPIEEVTIEVAGGLRD